MDEKVGDYTPSAAVLAAARRLAPDRGSGIERVTLSANGRSVTLTAEDGERFDRAQRSNPETGEVRRPPAGEAAAGEDWRLAGLLYGSNPDSKVQYPAFPVYRTDRFGVDYRLPLVEDTSLLPLIAARLIERHPAGLGALKNITIAYCWSRDTGMVQGDERLWRLRKPNDTTIWALGSQEEPRHIDVIYEISALPALYGQWTLWQQQEALHKALSCIRVRRGKVQLLPCSTSVLQAMILRYGPCEPNLQRLRQAMAQAESEQIPLFEEGWDKEDGDDEE